MDLRGCPIFGIISCMFDLSSNPFKKLYFWVGLGIGLLIIAIVRTYFPA